MARKTGSHSKITGPKIKQAALQLFARYGFAAVTMRQIAARVGVQAGAIYNYTPDKQALLFDLLQGHMADLLVRWNEEQVPGNPVAALDHFVAFHLDFHIQRPELVFISYMELRNLTEENFKAIEEQRSRYEKIVYDLIRKGVLSGDFQVPDAKITSFALIAMLTGVVDWFREDGRLPREELTRQYCALVRQTLGVNALA
ncbi:TetR/AcrR family transcriptional regulator [Planktomarina sp.]|uniref:TetR/AcrR family transcriptional regulator n=1 Tax=Planktomarina sp. TaxID=2024851 RepID=UPI002891B488|nr:TetR/AcrR family transcriptional regulator [Planktomarina sp.]MDT2030521.1 TetR/AcrR family transcriptional regulator [Planktomarina sp.]